MMETVKADLATAIGNAVDAYNAAMGYTAGQDEFVVKANFSVDVDKSGGFKVTYTGDNADKVNFSFGEKQRMVLKVQQQNC